MGRVKCLVRLGQARNGGAKVALLQAMQTEARLIEQKDGVLVLVRSLGKKDNEKRNQPLETFRALIEFDFDAEIIFDHDFEILTIGHDPQSVGLRPLRVRHPNATKFIR